MALAGERPLEDITIGDIVAAADVNRSSFYQHYSDKETLLADALDSAAEEAGAMLTVDEEPGEAPPQALVTYLEYLERNAELYRRVLGEYGSPVASARLRARIELIVIEGLTRFGGAGFAGLPVDIVAAGITGSALGVVQDVARDRGAQRGLGALRAAEPRGIRPLSVSAVG